MKALSLFFCLLFSVEASAQLVGTIQTGRPGQAIGAGVVGTGVIQFQSGLDVQTFDQQGFERTNRTLNNIVRLGLSERFEVSSVVDYSNDTAETATLSQDFKGFSQFQLGFRYNLIAPGDDFWPIFAIQTRFRLKSVSNDYMINEVAPVFIFSAVKPIDNDWAVAVNWGPTYNGFAATPTYNWVLSVSKSLTSRWGSVGEFYGSESNGQGSTFYGAGLSYLVNNDFQLDTYLSAGNNRGVEMFYGTVGISWRTLAFVRQPQ